MADSAETVKGYSYLRFSDPKQRQGQSTRRQREAADAWFSRHPEVTRDTTLVFEDRGVSGYTDEATADPRKAMARFLAHVESGAVRPGSFLLVENLDRLTRRHPVYALPWCLALIGQGVRIVQLLPEVVYDASMDEHRLMNMLQELCRGHGESKRKSQLIRDDWQQRQTAARESGKPHGAKVPFWVSLVGSQYKLDPDRSRTVRLIFQWAIQGLGHSQIVSRLIREGFKPFGYKGSWNRSYIAKILSSRAALGEYQPRGGRHGGEVRGEPIPNYFPPVVSESEWYAAQAAKKARVKKSGRPGRSGWPTSPFAGLLYNALDGEKLRTVSGHGELSLGSVARQQGIPSEGATRFSLEHFTRGLLDQLQELSAADLFNDQAGGKLQELDGRIAVTRDKLNVALERFNADPRSLVWQEQASAADKELRQLQELHREEEARAANPLTSTWQEALGLMRQDEPARLRQCLLSTVGAVWCLFVRRGDVKLAAVQVYFAGGAQRREYLLLSYVPSGWNAKKRKDRYAALSLKKATPRAFDLRDRKDARALARILSQFDTSAFERE